MVSKGSNTHGNMKTSCNNYLAIMPVTLLLLSVYLTAEKPITVEVVAMENPAGPSEPTTDFPKSTMPMQGKISLYHYLMLTTNQLKLCGN